MALDIDYIALARMKTKNKIWFVVKTKYVRNCKRSHQHHSAYRTEMGHLTWGSGWGNTVGSIILTPSHSETC